MGITDKFAHLQAPKQLKDMEIAVFWGRGRGWREGRGDIFNFKSHYNPNQKNTIT